MTGLDFQAIFAVTPAPILVLNREFLIAKANRRYEETVSAAPGSLLGRSIFGLFTESGGGSPPDLEGPRNLRASLERVLRLGEPDALPFQRFSVGKAPADGGESGERYISFVHAPVPGADGKVEFIVQHIEDVTAYVRSRQSRGKDSRIAPGRHGEEEFDAGIFMQARRLAEANRNLEASNRELVRMGYECKETARRRQRILAGLGKDFRAPLNTLMELLDGLRSGKAGSPPEGWLRRADDAAAMGLELVRLVNRLQDILQLDAVREDAEFRSEDLPAITSTLAAGFRTYAEMAGIGFDVDCRPLSTGPQVDREMWEKILLNLLSNAFKGTRKGKVRLRLREEAGSVVLEVSDTGEGIPQSVLAGIFAGPGKAGDGIGLPLVKKLVELHRGEVRIATKQGKGTQVTVRLPYGHGPAGEKRAAELPPGARREPSDPRSGSLARRNPVAGPARILVVEGKRETREYARYLLRALWDVQAAATSREAIDRCLEDPPDLILCEAELPDLNGSGLVRALRVNPRFRSLPILLVTGKSGADAASEAMEAGADGFLSRPYFAQELVATVDGHLKRAALRREAEREKLTGLQRTLEDDKAEMVGRLAAGVAHDFNNLLTAVNGYADLALGMTRDTGMRQCLLEIREAGSKAAETARLLLAFGRKQVFLPRPLLINDLVLEMRPTLRKLLGSVNLVIRLDPGLDPVVADRTQLIQVIMNLALNAREAMPQGGTFTLETANGPGEWEPVDAPDSGKARGFVRLTCQDTGIGIKPSEIGRIFEPYYTSSPYSAAKGKGLGLSSVLGIVRQHKGHIRARSRPGEGSTFEVLLPAADAAPHRSEVFTVHGAEPDKSS